MTAADPYSRFLVAKAIVDVPTGLTVDAALPDAMFAFQADLTRWALRRGRAALFAGTGLGKTLIELGRKGIGIELKPSYFRQAVRNLAALDKAPDAGLFDPAVEVA